VHHLDPMDKDRLVFPPLTAIVTYYIPIRFLFVFILFKENPLIHISLAGMILHYVVYYVSHYYLHHGTYMPGPLKYLRKCHMHHHFVPGGDKTNFGISPLGKMLDFALGTNYSPKN